MQGLYIHIPFCAQKCNYCGFVITTRCDASFRKQFMDALIHELIHARKKYGRLVFDTLYFGGGTPSVLSCEEIAKLLEVTRDLFEFTAGYEFSLEVNPTDVDSEKFDGLKEQGVNRISLGAQAFQDSLLFDLGRQHKRDDILRSFKLLRRLGYGHISMDLMIRLPGQTIEDLNDSLNEIIRLNPEQVTVYDLEVEPRSLYGAQLRRGRLNLPDERLHDEMNRLVGERLEVSGYEQYELSTFARLGYECRHNLIYWRNEHYLGVGPGAFSYMNGIRSRMADRVSRYLEKVEKADFEPDESHCLSPQERDMETLITGVRLKEGFDLTRLEFLKENILAKCRSDAMKDLVRLDGERLFLTDHGSSVADRVMAELL